VSSSGAKGVCVVMQNAFASTCSSCAKVDTLFSCNGKFYCFCGVSCRFYQNVIYFYFSFRFLTFSFSLLTQIRETGGSPVNGVLERLHMIAIDS
jgi:hypothetical protein